MDSMSGCSCWRHIELRRDKPNIVMMPLRFQVDHFQHIVVGVAEGDVTLQDVIDFTLEIERSNAAGYHKIVDVMAGTNRLTADDFVAYRQHMHGRARPHGPLALVSGDR